MKNMKRLSALAIVLCFLFVNVAYAGAGIPADKVKPPKKTVKTEKKTDPKVYIKENGKKYHKRNCHLVKNKTGILLSEAVKKGYTPCSVCKPAALPPAKAPKAPKKPKIK